MRVLLIEDSRPLVQTLVQSLTALGMRVEACEDGLAADRVLARSLFDVVVLDLALPGLGGIDLLHRLRGRNDTVPVLVLTASGGTLQRVQGLNAGADDYLAKPFDLSELEARLRALYRRSLGHAHSRIRVGALSFDTISRRFAVDGRALDLPPREHDLLESLVVHPGKPISKLELAQRLTGRDEALSHLALEVYVHRLRRRLEGSGAAIVTLRGLGYVLEAGHDKDP